MVNKGIVKLQFTVFSLVSASFTNIYLTQPVLPVLQDEFGVSPVLVSMTVSVVILGIVLSNLFFGYLSDRFSIHPIVLIGGIGVAFGGLVSALTNNFILLIAARLLQGVFIPALTTSLAAWLAKTLPGERLAVVLGSYVSATIIGGLGGRLLGGFIHPPLHWRYAFVSASVLTAVTTLLAFVVLPRSDLMISQTKGKDEGFFSLLKRGDLILVFGCGAAGLLMFSPIFNFLPYRLTGDPFNLSTELITFIYFVYVLGIFLSPLAGRFSNRYGGGNTLIAGSVILGLSLAVLMVPSLAAIVTGLLGVCAGFFTIHSVAVGLLNQKLSSSHGKANALYAMLYYMGGWIGITGAGFAFQHAGWGGVIGFVTCFLVVPLVTGFIERKLTK